jgi:outer membrane protein assembly factor BamB
MIRYYRHGLLGMICLTVTACSSLDAAWDSTTDQINGIFSDEKEASTADSPKKTGEKIVDIGRATPTVPIVSDALKQAAQEAIAPVSVWLQEGGKSEAIHGNMQTSQLKHIVDSVTVGEGNAWIPAAIAPSVVINQSLVIAMDGYGYLSAHTRTSLDDVAWEYDAIASENPLLTGGLALSEDGRLVYAVTSQGKLAAIDTKDGKTVWKHSVKEPIRSSIRLWDHMLFLVTADSQLLCFDANNGKIIWQHRGINEVGALFGTSLPAVNETQVIMTYPSGDMVALNRADGDVLWTDSLTRTERSLASGAFSGVDANPLIDEMAVFAASSSGLMVANERVTGVRLWEIPLGMRHGAWINGDVLYALSEHGDILAISKYRGEVGWMTSLVKKTDDDDMPAFRRYYGPFVIQGSVVAFDALGEVYHLDHTTGKLLRTDALLDSLAASPSFAGKYAYLLSHDATLSQVE